MFPILATSSMRCTKLYFRFDSPCTILYASNNQKISEADGSEKQDAGNDVNNTHFKVDMRRAEVLH